MGGWYKISSLRTLVIMTITPLSDNILIEPLEAQTQTASGIYLPDNAKEKPQMGKVVAVGAGKVHPDGKKTEMVVKVGQKVMYKKWGGTEVKVDGKEMMIVSQEDVLAIVEETDEAIKSAVKNLK